MAKKRTSPNRNVQIADQIQRDLSVLVRKWQISPWDATTGCALVSAVMYLPVYLAFLPKQMALAS